MTEIKCTDWYVDITRNGQTDTHTVRFPKPVTEFTAISYLFTHRLRRFSNDEQERLVIEATPASPNIERERS